MAHIKELEKYKQLLDGGAISEDEFRKLKQKLLGLETDEEKEGKFQQNREEALAKLEEIRAEEAAKKADVERILEEELRQKQAEASERMEKDKYKNTFLLEKAKEDARLKALYEHSQQKRKDQMMQVQKSKKSVTRVVTKVILWGLTLFFGLFSITMFFTIGSEDIVFSIISGIIFMLFAAMACPPLSAKIREIESMEVYCRYKKAIVITLLVLWLMLAVILLG
ncbi:MAG TPA: hypothetical protein GX707_01065 [Epulopiscium sp.]|nr:hypothetical protein [Candidatus Epulonipiscium sp.]